MGKWYNRALSQTNRDVWPDDACRTLLLGCSLYGIISFFLRICNFGVLTNCSVNMHFNRVKVRLMGENGEVENLDKIINQLSYLYDLDSERTVRYDFREDLGHYEVMLWRCDFNNIHSRLCVRTAPEWRPAKSQIQHVYQCPVNFNDLTFVSEVWSLSQARFGACKLRIMRTLILQWACTCLCFLSWTCDWL